MQNSILKTLTYAIMHVSIAVTVAFVLTGNLGAALAIGMIEPLVQTVAYHFHEKAWCSWQIVRETHLLNQG